MYTKKNYERTRTRERYKQVGKVTLRQVADGKIEGVIQLSEEVELKDADTRDHYTN